MQFPVSTVPMQFLLNYKVIFGLKDHVSILSINYNTKRYINTYCI